MRRAMMRRENADPPGDKYGEVFSIPGYHSFPFAYVYGVFSFFSFDFFFPPIFGIVPTSEPEEKKKKKASGAARRGVAGGPFGRVPCYSRDRDSRKTRTMQFRIAI